MPKIIYIRDEKCFLSYYDSMNESKFKKSIIFEKSQRFNNKMEIYCNEEEFQKHFEFILTKIKYRYSDSINEKDLLCTKMIFVKDEIDFNEHYEKRIGNVLKERCFWWKSKRFEGKVEIYISGPSFKKTIIRELNKIKN